MAAKEAEAGIYKIVCTVNGKCYVGSAVNLRKREILHRCLLNSNRHHSIRLQNSWNKHGQSSFAWFILESIAIDGVDKAKAREILVGREQYWIDRLNSARVGYNVSPEASSSLGVTHSPETRAKLSEGLRARYRSREARDKIAAAHRGRKYSEETIAKMSQAQTGKKASDETRAKLSAMRIGKKREPASPETRAKLSASHMGLKASAETKAKLSAANIGKRHSAETRAKIGDANRRRVWTEESLAKRSAARLNYQASPETRLKISKANLGKKRSAETCRRVSEATKEYWRKRKEADQSETTRTD